MTPGQEGDMKAKVRAWPVGSLLGELEAMQEQIMRRAHDIFSSRGGTWGRALDDWLTAERETVWRPAVELCEKDKEFTLEAAVAGVHPDELEVRVTPEAIQLMANTAHGHPAATGTVHLCEFQPGHLFRQIAFPQPIDPDTVKAELDNGLLRVTAAIAAPREARKVEVAGV
jgi:HSP20 family protein